METVMETSISLSHPKFPWNKGRLIGQKLPLKLKDIWAIRIRLQLAQHIRDLASFNLPIDRKLRIQDIALGSRVLPRAIAMQQKTDCPVQFEITEPTRTSIAARIEKARLTPKDYLFPSRATDCGHLATRQYARIVGVWVESIGLNRAAYGTHTIQRTKATLIYRQTKNRRAVQLLLGHS
jgi:hypothetical protein